MNCAFENNDPYDIPIYECISNINGDSLYERDVQKFRKIKFWDYINVLHKKIIVVNKPKFPLIVSLNPKLVQKFVWDYSESSPTFVLRTIGIKVELIERLADCGLRHSRQSRRGHALWPHQSADPLWQVTAC